MENNISKLKSGDNTMRISFLNSERPEKKFT